MNPQKTVATEIDRLMAELAAAKQQIVALNESFTARCVERDNAVHRVAELSEDRAQFNVVLLAANKRINEMKDGFYAPTRFWVDKYNAVADGYVNAGQRIAALEAENANLRREVGDWRARHDELARQRGDREGQ